MSAWKFNEELYNYVCRVAKGEPTTEQRVETLETRNESLRQQLDRLREKTYFESAEDLKDFLRGRHVYGDKEDIEEIKKLLG